jgi:succinate dehydrogenase / fumarate reductase cytochrome b subunit
MKQRPLSPFLVYRFMYTMALSFAHRLTGVALSVGSLLLVYAVFALSGDAVRFEHARVFFGHWAVQAVICALAVCFFYHLSNGVRHLLWDIGWGFEKVQARRSGWFVVVSTLALSALAVWLAVRAGNLS